MRGRRALAGLATGIVVAGCGQASLSLIQLRSRAGAICVRANRRLDAIPVPSTPQSARAFLEQGIGRLTRQRAELHTLAPPHDVRDVYASATSALSGELAALHQAARALAAPQPDPITIFRALQQRLAPLERQAADAWQALGVPACSSR